MKTFKLLLAAAVMLPLVASAQEKKDSSSGNVSITTVKPIVIQHIRANDSRGLNVFEPPKGDAVPYTGFKLDFGAGFTQQFQGLQHENRATAVISGGVNSNKLIAIGNGFNTAEANLNINAQIAPGIRVAMTSYLSAKHHNETWVKDGYALIDQSPIDMPILNEIMKYTTLKIGHFEINYGDEHFRRSDNGNAMFNPFVGNYLTDAFTTEVGGEVYLRYKGLLAMGSITNGLINGTLTTPETRDPAYIGKLGFDRQLTPALRARLTGSAYTADNSASNTLFTGDRSGSRYNLIMENTAATLTANAWSGLLRPTFGRRVKAYMVNPFVKYHGFEFFGTVETATGKAWGDTLATTRKSYRTWRQLAGEGVYRFWDEKVYAAYRYNTANGQLQSTIFQDVGANRWQLAGGWYVNPMMLLKVEYMNQKYYNFPVNNINYGGFVKGFVIESVLQF